MIQIILIASASITVVLLMVSIVAVWHHLKRMGALALRPLGKRDLLERYADAVVLGYSWDADRCTPVGIVFFRCARLPVYVTRDVYETIEKAFVKGETLKEILGESLLPASENEPLSWEGFAEQQQHWRLERLFPGPDGRYYLVYRDKRLPRAGQRSILIAAEVFRRIKHLVDDAIDHAE